MKRATTICALAAMLSGGAGLASAQNGAEEWEPSISGSLGTEVSTHFMSYGTDVWGAGGSWSNPSIFTWSQVTLDFELFDVTAGAWFDLNDNDASPIGGWIQEVDLYIGAGMDIEQFRFDVFYQGWHYGGAVEEVLDISVAFDDSDMLFEGFALNPSILSHTRLNQGAAAREGGTVFVFGIAPSFTVMEGEAISVELSIPIEVAFGVDNFYDSNGYGYTSIGGAVDVPLGFMPAQLGQWTASGALTYYLTDSSAIPENPRQNFPVGSIGLSVAF